MAAVEEREDEVKNLLVQAELKVSQIEQDKIKLDVDSRIDLDKNLRDLDADISEGQLTIASTRKLLEIAGQPLGIKNLGNLSYEILRRTSSGLVQITAEEITELEPGDLLKVSIPRATTAQLEAADYGVPSR
jgi:hypothetical protein